MKTTNDDEQKKVWSLEELNEILFHLNTPGVPRKIRIAILFSYGISIENAKKLCPEDDANY